MAGLLDFFKGAADFQSARATKDDEANREMSLTERKLKLANKLELETMQAKAELAKKYPKYSHFMANPVTGDVIGMDEYGNKSTVYQADDATRQGLLDSRLAKDAKAKSDAEAHGSDEDLKKARTDFLRDKMANPHKYDKLTKPTGGLTEGQTVSSYLQFLRQNGKLDELSGKMIPAEDSPTMRSKYQTMNGGLLNSASPSDGQEVDMDALHDALGDFNPFLQE